MVEAGRVCRMCKFSGNRCYPQCEDAGSSGERWQKKSSADHFKGNRLMVEAGRVCRMCKFSGNRCYPQCEDAGSSRERWQKKCSADHFKAID
ncbi:hypothetical protein CDAR_65871 [Caerostris darwini]|uniref:Uncharacterized protein n=1 Tax=Caerostris darwini TaxID=1538125 RepID=A0AAV4UC09_9ARAC|nr:hypothetical protein CDAR_65871 [Caerostris darwini]